MYFFQQLHYVSYQSYVCVHNFNLSTQLMQICLYIWLRLSLSVKMPELPLAVENDLHALYTTGEAAVVFPGSPFMANDMYDDGRLDVEIRWIKQFMDPPEHLCGYCLEDTEWNILLRKLDDSKTFDPPTMMRIRQFFVDLAYSHPTELFGIEANVRLPLEECTAWDVATDHLGPLYFSNNPSPSHPTVAEMVYIYQRIFQQYYDDSHCQYCGESPCEWFDFGPCILETILESSLRYPPVECNVLIRRDGYHSYTRQKYGPLHLHKDVAPCCKLEIRRIAPDHNQP